ncbi:hypothetical protein JCM21900_004009 [Sporobolomyces salmonicolor]
MKPREATLQSTNTLPHPSPATTPQQATPITCACSCTAELLVLLLIARFSIAFCLILAPKFFSWTETGGPLGWRTADAVPGTAGGRDETYAGSCATDGERGVGVKDEAKGDRTGPGGAGANDGERRDACESLTERGDGACGTGPEEKPTVDGRGVDRSDAPPMDAGRKRWERKGEQGTTLV